MSASHTPGPWQATHSDPNEGFDCWWITACPASNMEKEVATVSGGYPHETHEANARLIAAAPALLEAAIYAVQQLADGDIPDHDENGEDNDPFERLREVIAKATGAA